MLSKFGAIKKTMQWVAKMFTVAQGAADLIIKSYYHSFFKHNNSNVRICTARAGNVIGGGDWAKDRIIVDAIIAWSRSNKVEIRSPNATRPWQHVLEPLSGYLSLGEQLFSNKSLIGEAFNFGLSADQNRTVHELLVDSCMYWDLEPENAIKITDNITFHEAALLKLNCDKASAILKWNANLDYMDTIRYTNEWYYHFYNEHAIYNKTLNQISEYEDLAISKTLKWTE